MKKRIEELEQNQIIAENPAEFIRFDLYPRWKEGDDVSEQIQQILKQNPSWKERPPASVGKEAYIYWKEFTGYEMDFNE